MSTKPTYVVAVTTDRYDLDWEATQLNALDDISVDLRTAVCPTADDLIALARDADVVLVSSREPITAHILDHLTRCRAVIRYSVGLDLVDVEAATARGILVSHCPDYCTAEVADHALALILALNRRIVELDRDLRQGAWNEHRYITTEILRGPVPPLREQTLGIVGLGRIGRAVAARAAPFGLTLLAADPHVDEAVIREYGAEPVALDDLLARSDIVSIHCPLTKETHGMIGARELALMKPSATLVNTARGPIVDLPAAIDALTHCRIAGAALDVVYPEPPPLDSPLYQLPNVILTPHSAYYSERSVKVVREETLKEAIRVLRGQRPRTVANPAVLARLDLAPYA